MCTKTPDSSTLPGYKNVLIFMLVGVQKYGGLLTK